MENTREGEKKGVKHALTNIISTKLAQSQLDIVFDHNQPLYVVSPNTELGVHQVHRWSAYNALVYSDPC